MPVRDELLTKRNTGLAALAVLVVVDLILIVLALRPSPAPAATVAPLAAPTEAATPAVTPAAPTGAPAPDPEAFAAPSLTRMVAVRSDGSALAVLSGTCKGEVSVGTQIPATGAPQPIGLPGSVVGWLGVGGNGGLELVASSQDCAGQLLMVEGPQPSGWSPVGAAEGVGFLLPGGTDITLASGPTPYPCSVVSFDARGASATALCDDGTTRSTTDSTWQAGGALTNGLALAYSANSDVLVGLATAVDCSGVTVNRSANGGQSWARLSCVSGASVEGGPVGIGAQGATWVVVDAAGSAYRSVDGGEQFTPTGG